jgi:hypothetical protein
MTHDAWLTDFSLPIHLLPCYQCHQFHGHEAHGDVMARCEIAEPGFPSNGHYCRAFEETETPVWTYQS